MAVRNEYVDSNVAVGVKVRGIHGKGGAPLQCHIVTTEIAAADSDASILRFLKDLSHDLVPVKIEVLCDAITGCNDADVGFYETLDRGGAEIDKDILANGIDLSSAANKDGLIDLDAASRGKSIYEIVGHTIANKKQGYDLAITLNTAGTGTGTITVIAWLANAN